MGAMPGSSVLWLVYAIAFARLIVFLVADKLIEDQRDAFLMALVVRGHDKLAYLFRCPWCLSIWLAIPAAPIIYAYGQHWWLYVPAYVLVLSAAAGVLGRVKG